MYSIMFFLILFCSMHSSLFFAMEEIDENKESKEFTQKKNKKKEKRSKYYLATDSKNVSSFSYTNMELRQQASTIRRSQKYLQFLTLEFKTNHSDYKDQLIQFDLLRMLYEKYVSYTTYESQSGDCLDPATKEELRIRIQDRGSMAYFEQAMSLKIKAEKNYENNKNEKNEETLKRILRIARSAKNDFEEAHKIDKSNEESLKFAEEVGRFIGEVQEAIYDSPNYRLGLEEAKKAYALTREAYALIRSSRTTHSEIQEIPEEKEVAAKPRPRRSRTFGKIIKPKLEKRRSLPECEKYLVHKEDTEIQGNVVELEKSEDLCLKAISHYFKSFECYKEKILLERIQGLLDRINILESKRFQKTPHGIVIKEEIGKYSRQLVECFELLKKEEDSSSSSGSE